MELAGSSQKTRSAVAAPEEVHHKPLWLRLASTSFWLFITFTSIAIFPLVCLIWLLTLPFDRKKKLLHQVTCFWASMYTWVNPSWPVTVTGREHIRKNVPYVMVANHQSLLDILVLFRLFRHFKWVSKVENFRVPCIGWNMTLNGYVPLRRGDTKSILEMMRLCDDAIAAGNPVMMFPEGTRSVDGKLRPFKHGAFTLALRNRVPILPIVVEGTGNALPKAGFVLKRGRHDITVRVLPEIPVEDYPETAAELADRVRDLFKRELGQ